MKNTENIELKTFIRFKEGSEEAFEYFFHKFYNAIVGFCVQFIYDENDAKGLAQEAFLNLWSQREKIETVNGVSSFLYTYSKSKCLNIIRHKKVKEKYINQTLHRKETLLNIEILQSLQFDSLTFTELENLIYGSIEELPEKTKDIFRKKRIDQKKNQEIADELNISIKTVEFHFSKAIQALKIKLSDYLPTVLLYSLLTSYFFRVF